MCLVILLCTRASPQGPGFPCQGKGLMLPGGFLAKGVFFQSPAAQQGALGASVGAALPGAAGDPFGPGLAPTRRRGVIPPGAAGHHGRPSETGVWEWEHHAWRGEPPAQPVGLRGSWDT